MLDPHDRTNLVEALRPPPGFVLDAAVGTAFTLDLEALLTVPLAFALSAAEDDLAEEEPVGLLEAVRRVASRITVAAQAGQIAIPRRPRTVFAWLEECVMEVRPPQAGRLFHPKLWVIRYRQSDGNGLVLRVLCGTRNLTFDPSWDTLLTLESAPYTTAQAKGHPPTASGADLLRRLPSLTTRPLPADRVAMIQALADDLAHVPLLAPAPFTDVALHVLGLERTVLPLPTQSRRALVMSPFLGPDLLEELTVRHPVAAVIARPEAIDRIPLGTLERVGRVAVLNPSAEVDAPGPTARAEVGPPNEDQDPGVPLTGLHAKLYVFDTDDGSRVFTGSANATRAAFGGNVEVLAELFGPTAEVGVAALLADTPNQTGFDDLLLNYKPLAQPVQASAEEELQVSVDRLRHAIAGVPFTATVTPDGDQHRLALTTAEPLPPPIAVDRVALDAWPVTLKEDLSARPLTPGEPVSVPFPVSLEGLTTFFAIRITAARGDLETTSAFLVTASLIDPPPDRHSRLLAAMLRDPDRLLHYLLMLLADDDRLGAETADGTAAGWLHRYGGAGWEDMPLLEQLVRAVDRYPDRLDHFNGVLRDLGEHRHTVVPAGFEAIWEPVWTARGKDGR